MAAEKIRLGISACLLGQKVRYDGGHKLDPFLVNTLGTYVDYVPVCPEVECGFPVPRESLRLVGDPQTPRLVTTRSGQDATDRVVRWAGRRVVELEKEGLCGFIFKSRSPSSGMQGVKIYDPNGILHDYRIVLHGIDLEKGKTLKVEKNVKVWFTSEEATYDYWTNRLDNAKSAKEVQIMRFMRMKAIMGFPSKEKYAASLFKSIDDKCILFANTHEQADKLCTHSYHSSNPNSEVNLDKFKKGEIKKLSAVLQLNEGVNIPDLKQGIILHSYGNERKSSQRIGRLLRLNPDDTSTVHILYYRDTIDIQWVRRAIEDFDQDKIIWK